MIFCQFLMPSLLSKGVLDRSISPMPLTRSLLPAPSIRFAPPIRSHTSNWLAVDNAPPPTIETLPSIPSRSSLMRSTSSPQSLAHLLPLGTRASDDAPIASSRNSPGADAGLSRIRRRLLIACVAILPAQQAQRASQLTCDNWR
jgi:hypothetical protein